MKYFSLFLLLSIGALAVLAPFIFSYDPYFIDLSRSLSPPSWNHFFGLDENGKDVFIQVIYGSRISLAVTFSVVILSFLIGLILGTAAGWLEGLAEAVIMSLADIALAFPKFLTALALVAMLGGSISNLIFALCFSTWAGFARLARGEIKHLKKKEFALQAVSSGAGPFFLIYKHLWPGLLGLMFIHGIFQSAGILIAESGLSFLGLGAGMERPSWGSLLGAGREFLFEAPHLIFFPGLALFLFLLSLNYLGESLRDYLDPRGRAF